MRERLLALIHRIPWRLLVTALGGLLVAGGWARLLSVELPAGSEEVTGIAKQGMGMVVVGGVALIAVVLSR